MKLSKRLVPMTSAGVLQCLLLSLLAYGLSGFHLAHARTLNTIDGNLTILGFDGNEKTDHSNAVIFIDGIVAGSVSQLHQDPPKISHLGRKFAPHVLPLLKGGTVDFFNDDRIFHNVFSLSKAKTFDLGIYPQGTSKLVSFERTGLIKIYCNIHPKMVSNILVLNNPFFTKTDTDGSFTIENIPDGTYTLRIWHEFSVAMNLPVSFQDGQIVTQNLTITETKKVRSHKNKFGKPYKTKY